MKRIINQPKYLPKRYIPHSRIQEYFAILEPEIPGWLYDYINTPPMLHQSCISPTCGTIYSQLFSSKFFYSSLDHSVGVALIVWHFTQDKTQTIAGLFHDIATPVFKHSVDFLNGDYINQESTENLTHQIIASSPEITALLARDHITIEAVDDYHRYPIADNDTPRLAADRLEYTLSNSYFFYNVLSLEQITNIFPHISVATNESGVPELGFNDFEAAHEFMTASLKMSKIYSCDAFRFSLQFLADILQGLVNQRLLAPEDFYRLTEREVINVIQKSTYAEPFQIWREARQVHSVATPPPDLYSVCRPNKIRYSDPLLSGKRLSTLDPALQRAIKHIRATDVSQHIYIDGLLRQSML